MVILGYKMGYFSVKLNRRFVGSSCFAKRPFSPATFEQTRK